MKNKFRFFRFGLKTFLIFVLVWGVGVGWFAKCQREYQTELAAIAEIQAATKNATYDFAELGPRKNVMPTFLSAR